MPPTWKYERAGILLLACPIDKTNFPRILNPVGAKGSTIPTPRTRFHTWTLTGVGYPGVRTTFSHMTTPSSCTPGFSIKRIFPEYWPAGPVPTGPFYNTHTVPSLNITWLSRYVPLLGTLGTALLCPFIPWGSIKRIFPDYQKTILY